MAQAMRSKEDKLRETLTQIVSGQSRLLHRPEDLYEAIANGIDDIENSVRIPDTRFNKPLNVRIEDNKLFITADIKIRYGANVEATCELVQNKIYENLLLMTGFKASDVTVNVTGFEI